MFFVFLFGVQPPDPGTGAFSPLYTAPDGIGWAAIWFNSSDTQAWFGPGEWYYLGACSRASSGVCAKASQGSVQRCCARTRIRRYGSATTYQ
jgi:thiamine monophosphate kinase